MPIFCPYCRNKFSTRKLKPGRKTPRCPRCEGRFVIWLETFKLEDYESAVSSMRATLETAAGGSSSGSMSGERAGAVPPLSASVAPVVAPSRLMETAPPSVGLEVASRAIDQTTDFSQAPAGSDLPHAPGGSGLPHSAGAIGVTGAPVGEGVSAADFSLNGVSLAAPSAAVPLDAADEGFAATRRSLGGYRLVKRLGRGGMGDVYLATQVSLDRRVAVKTIRPELAGDPVFLSRFTREAYAAAQLTHHNVVQVYDLGTEGDTHFFSMEFVEGESLDRIIPRGGKLDAHDAVGYVLQAARGLHFAHEHGMVHRDVKPANLMLNAQGIVKVADLGLVKTAGSAADDAASAENPSIREALGTKATAANSTMGTPAYMAPEQADDAASVDHRADIYSLGCTLYSLVTGRLPFEGRTAFEVISKHKTQPLVRPEKVAAGVPSDVGDVVEAMTAKRPEDRPADMGEVVQRLENLLHGGGRSPAERFGAAIERSYESFRAPPLAAWRSKVAPAALAAPLLVATALLAQGKLFMSLAAVATALVGVLAYAVVQGVIERSILIEKLRELAFSARLSDYLFAAAGVAALVGLIVLTKAWFAAAIVLLLGVGGAVAFSQGIDRALFLARAPAFQEAAAALRHARIAGIDEAEARRIVAEAGGTDWEEFFEQVFSYHAKREARAVLAECGGRRLRKHAAWRDKLIDQIDARVEAARDARQRRQLLRVEAQRLRAAGVPPKEAAARACAEAAQIAEHGAALRVSAREYAFASKERRIALRKMVAESLGTNRPKRPSFVTRLLRIPSLAMGGTARGAVGLGLVVIGLWWAYENGALAGVDVSAVRDLDALRGAGASAISTDTLTKLADPGARQPWSLAPTNWDVWFSGFGPVFAGIALVATAFVSGFRGSALAWFAGVAGLAGPALLVGLVPPLLPATPPLTPEELLAAAGALTLTGLAWWQSD